MKKISMTLLALVLVIMTGGCGARASNYGVYLSSEYDTLPQDLSCEILVIDAQYYSAEEIAQLHEKNGKIYSYLNVGSVENFREYYEDFSDLFLGEYENWPEEQFIDVSKSRWQDFIVDTLAPALQAKGVDGLFLDNLDVYYVYPSEGMYDGITDVLQRLAALNLNLVINGGDVYVTEYMERGGDLANLITGVNQECVFTEVNWEDGTFTRSEEESRQYYLEYLDAVERAGINVYLIEYTRDTALEEEIRQQCEERSYVLYVSDSLELD